MDEEHKKYRIQDLEKDIFYNKEYLEEEIKDLTKYIEQRNQYSNQIDSSILSIASFVDSSPLHSQDKKQYIELILSGDEEKIQNFAQRFQNNWWAINFLVLYAKRQILSRRQLEKTISSFNEIIAIKENAIEELDLRLKQHHQNLIKLRN